MKLSQNSSGRDAPGRMGPRESPERDSSSRAVSGAHLNEIRERLLLEPRARREATIAWALEVHTFLSATRGIARWTDMHKETVQNIAGPTGGLSEHRFLYTATRGRSSVHEDEREDMALRFNSLAGRSWSPLGATGYRQRSAQYLSEVPIPSTPWTKRVWEEGKIQRGNGRIVAGIGEGLISDLVMASEEIGKLTEWGIPGSWSYNILTILDPAGDCWTEERFGKAGWHLAVLLGVQDVLVTSKDLQYLLGLKERMVRNLLAEWEERSLVVVEKVGRTKVFTLLLRSVLHPEGSMYDGHLGNKTKLYASMGRDQEERATAARRGTSEGAIAWKAANPRTRQTFLDDLPEATAQEWRELVERGDELEIHAYLVEQTKEAGPVPSTPKALVEKTVERRPAQESLEAAVVSQEKLAAMRKRIVADSYR
ncbi:hypothetical protein ACPCUK_03140 [Streptomyces arboris]|uniref:hypothetical protein n=1 Tax=Streptomyces arboris TaxID=2600619 RepID=UPI003C2F1DF6